MESTPELQVKFHAYPFPPVLPAPTHLLLTVPEKHSPCVPEPSSVTSRGSELILKVTGSDFTDQHRSCSFGLASGERQGASWGSP